MIKLDLKTKMIKNILYFFQNYQKLRNIFHKNKDMEFIRVQHLR